MSQRLDLHSATNQLCDLGKTTSSLSEPQFPSSVKWDPGNNVYTALATGEALFPSRQSLIQS